MGAKVPFGDVEVAVWVRDGGDYARMLAAEVIEVSNLGCISNARLL